MNPYRVIDRGLSLDRMREAYRDSRLRRSSSWRARERRRVETALRLEAEALGQLALDLKPGGTESEGDESPIPEEE